MNHYKPMETDLFYVQRKLGSGMFVARKISDVTGLDLTAIYKIRDGVTKNPRPETLKLLTEYFQKAAL